MTLHTNFYYNVGMRYESILDFQQKISCEEQHNPCAYLHFHRSIEIHYLIRGKILVRYAKNEQIVNAGEIMFIPSRYPHSVETLEENSADEVLIIPYNYFENIISANINLNYSLLSNIGVNSEIYKYMLLLKAELPSQSQILIGGLVNVIFGLIVKHYEPSQTVSASHDNIIEQIISYIDEHYQENITLDTLSKQFSYDKYYFSKLFNKTFNCTLPDYINSVRVEHVLNDTSKKPITIKILDAGFREVSTFYKYKKKHNRFTM